MKIIGEDAVEQALLIWFEELGYVIRPGLDFSPDEQPAERTSYEETILVNRLRTQLALINTNIPKPAIEDAIEKIINPNIPSQIQVNRQFHRWLRDGIPITFLRDGETIGDFVKLVDFNKPINNDWLVVNQFTVRGTNNTRRPDVVVFLNGLPIAVVELKNPADENATIWTAFDQLQTYKEQIADLFFTNELLIVSDGLEARVGSLTSDKERFMTWRTIDGDQLDPLGKSREAETLIKGLFQHDLLLAFMHDFILFEDDGGEVVKKIAGYHQFHAVRKAISTTINAVGNNRKAGVIWHTQGSGKSITMCFYAGIVMSAPEMRNPTLILVTDRNDLDGQLYGTFSKAEEFLRERPKQALSREELRDMLASRPSGGIIFTTIQKFGLIEEEKDHPLLSERDNIILICDEAHRTQYGLKSRLNPKSGEYEYGYAKHMRDALPKASFIAFTGTPVELTDRDTRAVFGEYIDIYDMAQAQEDKATVPILYESRLPKLNLDPDQKPKIDDQIEELTEDEEEDTQAKIKTHWAALEKLVGAEPRIKQVVADFLSHFENRQTAIKTGKFMFVCMSRDICVQMYDAIVALRPDWHDADPAKGKIKIVMTGSASDKATLRPHIYSKQIKKEIEKRFKDEKDELKVVIVRDMWLTGFDVPCLHTLYIDKPMRGHTLMQAIARVNRVFKDKPGGLVVDYIGIAHELKQALQDYSASGAKGALAEYVEKALVVLDEKLSIVRGMLHGFDYQDFETNAFYLLAGAADHILGHRDGKKRFADNVTALTKAFALCCTLDEALKYREEIAFFQAIKVALTKPTTTEQKIADEKRDLALRQIISKAVFSDGVVDIFSAAGLKKPDIGILSEEFLNEVRLMPQKNLAVELLERLLKNEVKTRFANNVVQYEKFSDLLEKALKRYHNRAIETAQVIEELIEMAREYNQAARRGEDLKLSNEELAFYDALGTNEASVRELGDEILKKIAIELTESLRKNVSVDWSVRETVRARLRLLVKRILRKFKYPPDMEVRAVELVLKQAEKISEDWVS